MGDNLNLFKALFLGPKSENADVFEKLLLDTLRDHVFWRRNFHPEDNACILEVPDKNAEYYEKYHAELRRELFSFLDKLKRGIPFHSSRYIGHMNSDVLMSGLIGYLAASLYNPNNVTLEASPVTTQMEIEFGLWLANMFGYMSDADLEKCQRAKASATAWGHLCSGGHAANYEALWVARNIKYYPIAVRNAAKANERLKDLKFRGTNIINIPSWTLLNISTAKVINLREEAIKHLAEKGKGNSIDRKEYIRMADSLIEPHTISCLGCQKFFNENPDIKPGIILGPTTLHYCWKKAADLLGIGRDNLKKVGLKHDFSMDIEDLQNEIEKAGQMSTPVIAAITVWGSTEEGALDRIDEIQSMRENLAKNNIWFYLHVDAAYGGYFASVFRPESDEEISDEEFDFLVSLIDHMKIKQKDARIGDLRSWFIRAKKTYQGLRYAESITVDPHKMGYIPYPAGAIVYKHRDVREMISAYAPYIFHSETAAPGQNGSSSEFIGRFILEGSKPGAAGAACWLSTKILPLDRTGYGSLIGRSIAQAQALYGRLKRFKNDKFDLEHLFEPHLNMVCFVLNKKENDDLQLMNFINQSIYEHFTLPGDRSLHDVDYVISKTEFEHSDYSSAFENPKGGNTTLQKLRINNFRPRKGDENSKREVLLSDDKIVVLRCVVMNPWITEKVSGEIDYIDDFMNALNEFLGSKKFRQDLDIMERNRKFKDELVNYSEKEKRNLRILLVEDEPEVAKTIQKFLSEFGGLIELVWAKNKVEAESRLSSYDNISSYDGMIIDINLSGLSGGHHINKNNRDGLEIFENIVERVADKWEIDGYWFPMILNSVYDDFTRLVSIKVKTHNKYIWSYVYKNLDPNLYILKQKLLTGLYHIITSVSKN